MKLNNKVIIKFRTFKGLSVFGVFIVLFIGCPKQTENGECDDIKFSRETGVLELNDSLYSHYDSLYSDVDIISANIVRDTLYIQINYLGGGIKHDFELVGQKHLFDSTLQVVLHQENKGDECTKEIIEDLKFDISIIKSVSNYTPLVEIQLMEDDNISQWYSSTDTLSIHGDELVPTSIGNWWVYYKTTWLVENDSLIDVQVDTIRLVDTIRTLGHLFYKTKWFSIPGLGYMFTNSNDTVYSYEVDWTPYKDSKFIHPYNDTITFNCYIQDYDSWSRKAELYSGYFNHNLGIFEDCIKYVDDDSTEIILYPGVGVLYQMIPYAAFYPSPETRRERILIDYHIE